jgi:hypothetical protein
VIDTGRHLVGPLEHRAVDHRLRIEDHEVGKEAGTD